MNKNGFVPIVILVVIGILISVGGAYYFTKKPGKNIPADLCSNLPEKECLSSASCAPTYKSSVGSDNLKMPLFDSAPVFENCGPAKTQEQVVSVPVDNCLEAENFDSDGCKSGRDATRISDARGIQIKLELYYSKFGEYPQATNWATLSRILTDANLNPFPVPSDPLTPRQEYKYGFNQDGSDYILGITLEKTNSKISSNEVQGDMYGLSCGGSTHCPR